MVLVMLAGCATASPSPQAGGSSTAKNPVVRDLMRCLNDAGFEAEETWNGGLVNSGNTPPEQMDAYTDALALCGEELDVDSFALTDAQLAQLYDQELAERECLIAAGYGVDEPPSLQTFTDTWNNGPRWTAWDASEAAVPTALDPDRDTSLRMQKELALTCPPPSWWLNLDGL